jgi:hypothetical protein
MALATGLACADALVETVAGSGVAAQPGDRDAVEGGVGLPVAAAVEPVPPGLAGGRFDRAGAAQRGEGRLVVQPFGVVAGGDEQGGRAVRADAGPLEQLRGMGFDRVGDARGKLAGKLRQAAVAWRAEAEVTSIPRANERRDES